MNGETTITGYLPFINMGDNLNLDGKFLEHKVYGEQFVVDTFEKTMPETTDAIERYLSNGVIKGLGKATAKKIVKEFGEDTINVIRYEYKELTRVCEGIPIVLVGNKVDVADRKVKARQILFPRKHGIQYYDISAKSNYQFEKPFLWLLKKLTGDPNLTLVEAPALKASEVSISQEQIAQMTKELEEAKDVAIDDNEDENL